MQLQRFIADPVFQKIWLLLLIGLLGTDCQGEDSEPFLPPLLLNTDGLENVQLQASPLRYGETHKGRFSQETGFMGHIFAVGDGATLSLAVWGNARGQESGVAIYGPRKSNGLFGDAIAFTSGNSEMLSLLRDLEVSKKGDYLVLVADLSDGGGEYLVQVDCSIGCELPECPPLICGLYCPSGLIRDEQECPRCECSQGCQSDADCPLNYSCQDGICQKDKSCICDQPYAPVCGVDGRSYANECERDCAQVELDHQGLCDTTAECENVSDCPSGMVCTDGRCVLGCDCRQFGYNPVCGTDQVTYPNDCERKCAQVELSHFGVCEECSPEICDEIDNDCDGAIDEGCGPPCQADSNCPWEMICWEGFCVDRIPCNGNDDCPRGQECSQGSCRGQNQCQPEICDGLDNDCDGVTDEGCPACRSDSDCPEEKTCNQVTGQCVEKCQDTDGDGWNRCQGDCDDNNAAVHPAAQEVCDNLDNNCDAGIDEGCLGHPCAPGETCLDGLVCINHSCQAAACLDQDNDGFSDNSCGGTDCDDNDPNVYPGAMESCDASDSDCDLDINEGCRITCAEENDCPEGEACTGGICLRPCRSNDDCPQNQECLATFCVLQDGCLGDGECNDGNAITEDHCRDRLCIHLSSCENRSNCKSGQMCFSNVCLGDGICGDDADCTGEGMQCDPNEKICVHPCRLDTDCSPYQVCHLGLCAP